jgi:NAD(P)H-flavin reductase
MLPRPHRVVRVRRETRDTVTLALAPVEHPRAPFAAGQFNMLYAFGVGEVPISISGDPTRPDRLLHTVRAVGKVSEALYGAKRQDILGVRGPFGRGWPIEEAAGCDVVIAAGGIGLAPLRPALCELLAHRDRYARIILLYGARTPHDLIFERELNPWRGRFDLDVEVCGPGIMMRFTASELQNRGVSPQGIYVSMERNMKCAIGFCGHCQFGPTFVCKDGPVFRYDRIASSMKVREV